MADTNKFYLDLAGLTHYDSKIKKYVTDAQGNVISDVSTLKEKVATIDTSVGYINTSIGDISTRVNTNTTDISTLNDWLKDVSTLAETNKSTLQSIGNITEALANHANANDAKFAEVDSSIGDIKSDISGITTDLTALTTKVTNVSTAVDGIQTTVTDHGDRITALETYKTVDLKDKLDAIDSKDSAQDTSLGAHESRLANLESKTIADLVIGGHTYNGSEKVTVSGSFTEDPDTNDLVLNIGGKEIARFSTSKFTKDAFVKDVKIDEGNLVIEFNIDKASDGNDTIKVPLTDIFDGKATSVKLVSAINSNFVTIAAGTNVEDALSAIVNVCNDFKSNNETKQDEQDDKIKANETAIQANAEAIAAFTPITNTQINALFGE